MARLQFLLRVITEGTTVGAAAGRSTQREKLGQTLVAVLERNRYLCLFVRIFSRFGLVCNVNFGVLCLDWRGVQMHQLFKRA